MLLKNNSSLSCYLEVMCPFWWFPLPSLGQVQESRGTQTPNAPPQLQHLPEDLAKCYTCMHTPTLTPTPTGEIANLVISFWNIQPLLGQNSLESPALL